MKDLDINTIFPYKGKLYKVIKNNSCIGCAGECNHSLCSELRHISDCDSDTRNDNTNIQFLELSINSSDIAFNRFRRISDTVITIELNTACKDCVFYNTCNRTNSNNNITIFEVNKYFGKCKGYERYDNKSIVFKIKGKNNFVNDKDTIYKIYSRINKYNNEKICKNNNEKIISLYGENYIENDEDIKDIKINIPKGYDYEVSTETDFHNINVIVVKFNKKYLTYDYIIKKLGKDAIVYNGSNKAIDSSIKYMNIIHYYNLYYKSSKTTNNINYVIDYTNKSIIEIPADNNRLFIRTKDAATEIMNNPNFKDILSNNVCIIINNDEKEY